jgi:hypothetical protein
MNVRILLSMPVTSESNMKAAPSQPKRHETYRRFGGYNSFAEAEAELRAYWQSRTPEERMEALEALRIANYGEETINARIPRVFGVPESRRS